MKQIKFLAIIAFAAVIAFTALSLAGCDNDSTNDNNNNGGGGGNTTATFTMQGYHVSVGPISYYTYNFRNYSSSSVMVTISGSTQTVPAVNYADGYGSAYFEENTRSSVSVSYSPANKVRYENKGGGMYWFFDK